MSLKSSSQIEADRYQLEVEADADTFEKVVNQTLHKQGKKITVPGFCKGKALRVFIEKYYGEQFFYEDAVDTVYPVASDEAVKAAQLRLVDDKIDFDVVSIDEDGLMFRTIVITWPEVSISDYKGFEASKAPVEATDEDIDKGTQEAQERNSRTITIEDRPIQLSNVTVVDFGGLVDGIAFEGGETKDHILDPGSGRFTPGFEEQVVGRSTGEEFSITITFPEDYQASTLQNKETVFKIKLHEIKQKELPTADDDFAKDVSELDTLEAYKEDIRRNLLKSREKAAQDEVEAQLVDQLVEKLQGETPETLYQNKINDSLRDLAYRLRLQDLDFNTHLKYTGMDRNMTHDHLKSQAEKQAKARLALEEIVKLEEVRTTAEEIETELEKLAKTYSMEVDKVKSFIPEKDLAQDLAVEKVVGIIRDSAKITEKRD